MENQSPKLSLFTLLVTSMLIHGCGSIQPQGQSSTMGPGWELLNKRIIEAENVSMRERDVPRTGIQTNVGEGQVSNLSDILPIQLAPGVEAKAYWGEGNLLSFISMAPNAVMPRETIIGERFLFVMEGQVKELANGEYMTMVGEKREPPNGVSARMPRREFIYLVDGDESHITAGPQGAEILLLYAPVPRAYLEQAGLGHQYEEVDLQALPLPPNVDSGVVYDLYDFQYTVLVPGANARFVNGRGMQMSWLRMNPNIEFGYHTHPEQQLMIAQRGWLDQYILAHTVRVNEGDILNFPYQMTHGALLGTYGTDALDVFFPPRTDYYAAMERTISAYHEIIPEDTKVQLVVDGSVSGPGLNFTEGPAWHNGKLYFSNLWFDPAFNGDASRGAVVEMDPNGSYRYISTGMQTNGIIPAANGNLIVADMFGHRVIEMTTAGEVVATLADSYDESYIDGPNDLVMDTRGGIYFSDPQFTPSANKNQPGRTVYYRNPQGEVIRLLPYDDFAMPNGIILSPDGRTLYINNTYDKESWWNVTSDKENYVWAYDVNQDGTISNGRAFAELKLTGDVLNREARTSGADGMAIDTEGNLYVASYAGVQIFNAEGNFKGIVNLPTVPVNVTFGGADNKTLYITAYDKIYRIKTNKTGYQLY